MSIQTLNMGLIAGRHDLPADQIKNGFIIDRALTSDEIRNPIQLEQDIINKLSKIVDNEADDIILNVTVTGLTVVTVALINACTRMDITLYLLHYDRDMDGYFLQEVLTH